MFTSAVAHRFGTERAWTEHLATTVGATALLGAVRHAPLPEPVAATVEDVLAALAAETAVDADGDRDRLATMSVGGRPIDASSNRSRRH